tara:strand:- start:986 stop:1891 length:906 start_codon:yes stop_codon:yes gene_type:complete
MASTYTTNIRLTKQGDGDNPNSWGLILNNEVIDLVDSAIAAYTTISCSSADITLTESNGTADQSRSAMLEFVGTVSSNINIIVPTKSKFYIVNDQTVRQSSSSITVKTASGSGATVDASAAGIFFSDAVSVYSMNDRLNLAGVAEISSSNTFTNTNTFTSAVGFATSVSITQAHLPQVVAASVSVATINKATFIKQVAGTPVTLTDAASIAVDFATGTNFVVSLGGNRTLENPSNAVAGQTGHIYVIQDGTGSRTLAFGNAYNFVGGTAPTMSTSINSVDLLIYNARGVSAIDTVFVSSFG